MVFWIGILISVIFAYFAIKKGFYETWTLGFNIIISIYLAVSLGPVISGIIPMGTEVYNKIITTLAIAAASFLILQGTSYILITSQFNVPFPKIIDVVGAGLLGFLIGLLVWSFVCLLIMTTPITKNTFVKKIGFDTQAQQANISYISWWCNTVNRAVSSRDSKQTAQQAIGWLLKSSEPKTKVRESGTPEPNEPSEPIKPNETKPTMTEKQQP
jgi:uncharacterized membrane protein required for colicin V production